MFFELEALLTESKSSFESTSPSRKQKSIINEDEEEEVPRPVILRERISSLISPLNEKRRERKPLPVFDPVSKNEVNLKVPKTPAVVARERKPLKIVDPASKQELDLSKESDLKGQPIRQRKPLAIVDPVSKKESPDTLPRPIVRSILKREPTTTLPSRKPLLIVHTISKTESSEFPPRRERKPLVIVHPVSKEEVTPPPPTEVIVEDSPPQISSRERKPLAIVDPVSKQELVVVAQPVDVILESLVVVNRERKPLAIVDPVSKTPLLGSLPPAVRRRERKPPVIVHPPLPVRRERKPLAIVHPVSKKDLFQTPPVECSIVVVEQVSEKVLSETISDFPPESTLQIPVTGSNPPEDVSTSQSTTEISQLIEI